MSEGRGHDDAQGPDDDPETEASDHPEAKSTPEPGPPHPFDRVWLHPSELPVVTPGRPESRRRASRTRAVAALVAAAATGALVTIGVLAVTGTFDDDPPPAFASSARAVTATDTGPTIEEIVDAVASSVVEVRSIGPDGAVVGSGVALRRDGEVLTAVANIAEPYSVIVVVDHRGDEHRAQLLGRDPDSGLALVAIGATLRAATLTERDLEPGDEVLSLGVADNTATWISEGITSAVDVRLGTGDGLASTHLLTTDVRPGRRGVGGALVDRDGTVAGIVLAPVVGDPTTYAVPIDYALEVADHLRTGASVPRGWLGISGDDGTLGVVVAEVSPGGPAWRAGVVTGDIITAIDGRAVSRMLDLVAEVRELAPGTIAELELLRGSEVVAAEVVVEDNLGGAPDRVAARPVSFR